MDKKSYIFFIFFFGQITLGFAQGFDWQYSARLPFKFPYLFGGVSYNSGYSQNHGKIYLQELEQTKMIDCCNFTNGTGFTNSFGLDIEYWQTGLLAFKGRLSYSVQTAKFSATPVTLPRIGYSVTYQNDLNSVLNYISLELQSKYRLYNSHFSFALGFETGLLVSNSLNATESIISPDYEHFIDGSTQRTIYKGKMSNLSKINIIPKIYIGYDLNLGLSMYASPSFSVGFPLMNITQSAQWRAWHFDINISVYRGLLFL